jgi:hypothetical protein
MLIRLSFIASERLMAINSLMEEPPKSGIALLSDCRARIVKSPILQMHTGRVPPDVVKWHITQAQTLSAER